ncbi:MAG: DUF1080 domain-containing protein [Pirellulales bacterium]|nr:DUF1080 domain-containing protein [Pirellulales bacterium]
MSLPEYLIQPGRVLPLLFVKPAGQWNRMEITCVGPRVQVAMNGATVVDADLDAIQKTGPPDGRSHPGLANRRGHIGLFPINGRVEFRNLRVSEITAGAFSEGRPAGDSERPVARSARRLPRFGMDGAARWACG